MLIYFGSLFLNCIWHHQVIMKESGKLLMHFDAYLCNLCNLAGAQNSLFKENANELLSRIKYLVHVLQGNSEKWTFKKIVE